MWLESRAAAITYETHRCTYCTLLYRHLRGDTRGQHTLINSNHLQYITLILKGTVHLHFFIISNLTVRVSKIRDHNSLTRARTHRKALLYVISMR